MSTPSENNTKIRENVTL